MSTSALTPNSTFTASSLKVKEKEGEIKLSYGLLLQLRDPEKSSASIPLVFVFKHLFSGEDSHTVCFYTSCTILFLGLIPSSAVYHLYWNH